VLLQDGERVGVHGHIRSGVGRGILAVPADRCGKASRGSPHARRSGRSAGTAAQAGATRATTAIGDGNERFARQTARLQAFNYNT